MFDLKVALYVNRSCAFKLQLFYDDEDVEHLGLPSKWITVADVVANVYAPDGSPVIDSLAVPYVADSEGFYYGKEMPDPAAQYGKTYDGVVIVTKDGIPEEIRVQVTAEYYKGKDTP